MRSSRNIVLTGFMGTGKTTVGRHLAELLDRQFVDTDALIEMQHGPIPAIFAEHGEAHFRHLEQQVAEGLASSTDLVIATGGKLLLDPDNVRTIDGRIFSLVVPDDEILRRVGRNRHRPLAASPQAVRSLLAERRRGYRAFTQVDASGPAPSVAAEIRDLAVAEPRRVGDVVIGTALAPDIGRTGSRARRLIAEDEVPELVLATFGPTARDSAQDDAEMLVVLGPPAAALDLEPGRLVCFSPASLEGIQRWPELADRGVEVVVDTAIVAAAPTFAVDIAGLAGRRIAATDHRAIQDALVEALA